MTEGWALVAVSAFYIFLLLYSLRFIVKCLTGGAVGPALLVVVGIGLSAAYTVHILGGYYPGDVVTALAPQHIRGRLLLSLPRLLSFLHTSMSTSQREIG